MVSCLFNLPLFLFNAVVLGLFFCFFKELHTVRR